MRILITGAEGMLGGELMRVGRDRGTHQLFGTSRARMDVTDPEQVESTLGDVRPDVVVHAAAYTDVDGAEENADEAFRVNSDGARIVAEICESIGARCVYISTDFVFDGTLGQPYRPDDLPDPLGVYGQSKLAGELQVRDHCRPGLIVRTSWLYGAGGGNFVDTISRLGREKARLRVVNDQFGRPTWTHTLATVVYDLIDAGATGTFHVSDAGIATWYELALEALSIQEIDCVLAPVTTEEWNAPAPRPAFSVLDLSRTEAVLGRSLPHWKTSLHRCLKSERGSQNEP